MPEKSGQSRIICLELGICRALTAKGLGHFGSAMQMKQMNRTMKLTPRQDSVPSRVRQIGALVQRGDPDKAKLAALELLNSHPKRPEVHNILGLIYIQQNMRNRAIPHLEFATKAEPRNSVYLNNLGRLYLELQAIELALPFLHNALAIDPKLTATLISIGEYYLSVGKAALGLPYLERALHNEPKNKTARWVLAEGLDALGKKDEANNHFQKLWQEGEMTVRCLHRISRNNRPEQNVPLMAEAERLLQGNSLSDPDRSMVHTALGFMLENDGRYQLAFDHFHKANRLKPVTFDIEPFRTWVDTVIEKLTADVFRARINLGNESALPVLVVGMPRSGTTLTEQVIASHGRAAGAGELTRISLFARTHGYSKDVGGFIQALDRLGPGGTREIADNYVNLLRFHAQDALRVVDKMPHNFLSLGFVALLWPKARIIHCSRNPADTCLSCYQNPLNDSHSYSRDLSRLGLYYREYRRLMEHWKKVLPMQIYDLSYERFTADFEGEARKLIEFIGLPWDPACLKFNEAESTVRTFSRQQVRNPIYKSSVERWRRYEAQLQPLVTALGDLMESSSSPIGPR
jgi:tetratricopeptide (TPR) repeat protein